MTFDGNDEEMVNFLDEVYEQSISNEIRERRRGKKQRDQEALVISQDMAKIPEVTDILTSEQDKQDLSQSDGEHKISILHLIKVTAS